MCKVTHNVPANKLLVALTDNINIKQQAIYGNQTRLCEHCEQNPVVQANIGNLNMCHTCLTEDGFLQCCGCKKYVSTDLLTNYGYSEYLDALVEHNLEDEFICEACSSKQYTNVYELSGEELLEALGVNIQSIADFRDEIIKEVGGF